MDKTYMFLFIILGIYLLYNFINFQKRYAQLIKSEENNETIEIKTKKIRNTYLKNGFIAMVVIFFFMIILSLSN